VTVCAPETTQSCRSVNRFRRVLRPDFEPTPALRHRIVRAGIVIVVIVVVLIAGIALIRLIAQSLPHHRRRTIMP